MPTTNPVPSQDPSDLLFNAGKLDEVVSGSNATYTDRLGISRRTMAGIDAAADLVLGGLGYAPPVAYAAGIALTLTTQTVEYAGEVYAPKVANLPFTTSGTFETAKFRLIQGVASADLASGGGAAMVGYTPAGAGAVATTVQSKLRETVSVLDFYANGVSGAKVDPTGSIDSAAGIQAAINSLPYGGVVHIPPGVYKCGSTITVNEGITLQGSGRRSVAFPPTCWLSFSTTTGTAPSIQTNNGSDITLKDFYLSGRASGSGNEIQINGNSRRISIENVTVNTSTTGSAFSIGIGGFCIQSRLVGCAALGAGYGFNISQASTSVSLISCYANVNTVAGYLIKGTYLSLVGCASDANGLYGYLIQNAISVNIDGSGAENNGRAAINFISTGNITINGFRSVANNTQSSSSYPSFAMVDYGSYNIIANGVEDSIVNAATVYSVSHSNGNSPSNIEFNGTFTKPFNPSVVKNESPRQSVCAVVNFDGTSASPTPIAGRNIVNILKNGAGDYTVTFTQPRDVRTIVSTGNAAANGSVAVVVGQVNSTADTVRVRCYNGSTGALIDSPLITLHIFAI